jgi:hypothetical protein
MNKLACRYAVVQFMPHAETEEFVNVGVVVACPQTGFFDFKLETRKHKRVTDFFDELAPATYRAAMAVMRDELERTKQALTHLHGEDLVAMTRMIFDQATHPREALVRFSKPRVVLAEAPAKELERLSNHYVDRAFASREHVEAEMARRIGQLLKTLNLTTPFKQERVGDDVVHATFPLVQRRGDQVFKVIKPLDLNKRDANAIYERGDDWIQKVKRLRGRGLLPVNMLFPLARPTPSDARRIDAFEDIRKELIGLDVEVVDQTAQDSIIRFATH